MIDKRFWSGAIAVVTLIVAGAGALPELLLRPAPTAPTVVVAQSSTTAEPLAKPEQTGSTAQSASLPADNRADNIAPAEESIAAAPRVAAPLPEPPRPEPEVPAPPAAAPPVAFPPVQPVGAAAASVPDAVPPANPQATPAIPTHPGTGKPHRPERAAQRPAKPKQAVRPATYPIGEFLAWRP